MKAEQNIRNWKNADAATSDLNNPAGQVQTNLDILKHVQGGIGTPVYQTGCIPDPFPFPKKTTTSIWCPPDDVTVLF